MDNLFAQQLAKLRDQAETRMKGDLDPTFMDEIRYELQIHQTELEVQYEELERAKRELQTLYQEYWNLYEFAPCGYVTLNSRKRIVQINQAGRKLLGKMPTPLTCYGLSQFIPSQYQSSYFQALQQAAETGEKVSLELQLVRADRAQIWVHLDIEAILAQTGEAAQWRVTLTDITAQKAAEQAQKERELVEAQAQQERLLNTITSAIRQTLDLEEMATQTVTQLLQAFSVSRVVLAVCNEQETEFDLVQVAGEAQTNSIICNYFQAQQWLQDREIFSVTNLALQRQHNPALESTADWNVRSLLIAGIFSQKRLQGVVGLQNSDRARHWKQSEQTLIKNIASQLAIALQQAKMYRQLQTALSQQHHLQEQLRHDAIHDRLTGLPNRTQLITRLNAAIERRQTKGTEFVVFFLDLNGFKQVNDTHGHTIGDELLKVVAQRLSNCLREEDLLARFGGDEFVIVLEGITEKASAIEVADRLHESLKCAIVVQGIHLEIGTSIGIVFAHSGYTEHDAILRDADIAMYEAKHREANYMIFDG